MGGQENNKLFLSCLLVIYQGCNYIAAEKRDCTYNEKRHGKICPPSSHDFNPLSLLLKKGHQLCSLRDEKAQLLYLEYSGASLYDCPAL